MKSYLLVLIVVISVSCQKDIDRNERLYGKWVLTGGTALQKRKSLIKSQPAYLVFEPTGSVQSNGFWNCYNFQFGAANALTVNNNCLDCIVVDCGKSTWHYQFTAPDELTIEFQPDDVGVFRKQ